MRRRLRYLIALGAALLACSGAGDPTVARGDFTPDMLVSGSPSAEADYGSEPVISAAGNYLAFVGSYLGTRGIWRKNLQSGALDFVAGGDASAPSISANGQYISFTTTSSDPATGGGNPTCPSVWVRDMSVAIVGNLALPGAFTLASALDGSSSSLTYAGSPGNCFGGGSSAAPRAALSADGTEVAFTVDGESNLMTGAGGPVTTPPAQVAVRYLNTDTTILVSQTMASLGSPTGPEPVPNGAAVTDQSEGLDDSGGQFQYADPDSTAAISADGSTVAWQGIEIPDQAPASTADAPVYQPFDYSEPLWRRIADGPAAPIRRVTGGDDPVGPCPGGCTGPLDTSWVNGSLPSFTPNQSTGPYAGTLFAGAGALTATTPFGLGAGVPLEDATPQLSADGQTVAILSTQPSSGQDPACAGFGSCGSSESTNAFVVNMAPGLSRTQALTRLTQWANDDFGPNSLAGTIDDIAISPEGDRVAFTTVRTVFPYSPPALISAQLSPVAAEQLYVADLRDGTLEVASIGYDGQPANGNVLSPSLSAGNGPIAFASQATNLVYGALSDTRDGFEVFTTTEVKPPAIPGVSHIGPLPANPVIAPDWRISATAHRTRDGAVLLSVSVPAAGRLSAVAAAGVPSGRAPASRKSSTRAATRASHRVSRRHGHGRVIKMTLARAVTAAGGAGVVELRLAPATHYAPLIARARGLYATVTVMFAVVGRKALVETLPVDFRITAHTKHRSHRRAPKASKSNRSAG